MTPGKGWTVAGRELEHAARTHVAREGGPCVNATRYGRQHGCRGRLRVRDTRYRDASGAVSTVAALICDRCGQAHGRAGGAA